jgi:putative ABC transport system permease protein
LLERALMRYALRHPPEEDDADMDFLRDLRSGFRALGRSRAFSCTVISILALGIAATTAVFSIVNALLLKPYPYQDPERIYMIEGLKVQQNDNTRVSYPDYVSLRESNRSFEEVAAVQVAPLTMTTSGQPVLVKGARASASLFSLLGGKPVLGRAFLPEEDRIGAPDVAVLSEIFWRSRFQADPGVLGKEIQIDGRTHEIIGVIPYSAQFPDTDAAKIFVPIALDPLQEERRQRPYFVLGRLKDGISIEQAEEDLRRVGRQLSAAYPLTNEDWTFNMMSLREFRTQDVREIFLTLFGFVFFVLLISCANAANLFLQKASVRDREFAIRTALGAARWRLFRQLLSEGMVIALIAGAIGLVLATWFLRWVVTNVPLEMPSYMNQFRVDARVFVFVFGLCLLTALLFSLAPALGAGREDITHSLKEGGIRLGGVRKRRFRSILLGVEVALSMTLLIGAGVSLKSFLGLLETEPGFEVDEVIAFEMTLPERSYPESHQRVAFADRLLNQVARLPEVASAAVATSPPSGGWPDSVIEIRGQAMTEEQREMEVPYQLVSPAYFTTIGVLLQRGRTFNLQDGPQGLPVAVISARLAERLWPDEDPLGQQIRLRKPGRQRPGGRWSGPSRTRGTGGSGMRRAPPSICPSSRSAAVPRPCSSGPRPPRDWRRPYGTRSGPSGQTLCGGPTFGLCDF